MPRYFFHVDDGSGLADKEGTELADDEACRVEAVRFAGALLFDASETLWKTGNWELVVDADGGRRVCAVTVAAKTS